MQLPLAARAEDVADNFAVTMKHVAGQIASDRYRWDCAATRVLSRLLGSVGGGYALTAAAVPLAGLLLSQAGMPRSEAATLAMMLGFVFYAIVLLWAFSVRSLVRLWGVLVGGAAACIAALMLLR